MNAVSQEKLYTCKRCKRQSAVEAVFVKERRFFGLWTRYFCPDCMLKRLRLDAIFNFILLPFLIAYLMLGQLVDMLLALTQPLMDVMPGVLIESEAWRRAVAFGALIAICIFVALIADTAPARRFGRWFESAVMGCCLRSVRARGVVLLRKEVLPLVVVAEGEEALLL